MNGYVTKINGLSLWNDLQYRQWMTAEIASQVGFREMGIFCYDWKEESSESLRSRVDGIIAGLSWGEDVVICQFPTGNGFRFEWELVSRLKLYRCRVVIYNNAPETLVGESNKDKLSDTIKLYNQAEVLIVPSLAMHQFLLDNGIREDMKFVIQEMWDYTVDMNFFSSPQLHREIHFVGNSFAGMDGWNYALPLKLYTSSTKQEGNIYNMGELPPGNLISELSKGGFGLVWYQDEDSRRCMEYGAPFSLTRYLAAGIPVIVPVGISNQMIIEKNRLGLVVNSLEEAVSAVETMTEFEYQQYIRTVGKYAQTVRNGYYTKKCLVEAIHAVHVKDSGTFSVPVNVYDPGEQEFTYTVLKESYGGNLALSWSYHGKADGFLIYDTFGNLIYETRNMYQHYFLIKGYGKESKFVIKAYVDTMKGKMVIAESEQIYHQEVQFDHEDVSLIIPIYNAQDYIIRCIDNALAQSFLNLEIILIDDGSTDHTSDIVDWYTEKYSNVKSIHQKNSGVGMARNMGIRYAQGEYLGFMDSDDMIQPGMIKNLYYSAKKNDCDIVITSVYRVGENGHGVFIQYPWEEDIVITIEDFIKMHFDNNIIFSVGVWNKLYRSTLVKDRLFPEIRLGEDAAWTPYVLSYAEKICYINDFLYELDRTIHKDSLETKWLYKTKKERFIMYKNIVMFYLKDGNPERREILKMLTKRLLLMWSRVNDDTEYLKLSEEIDKSF